MAYLNFLKPIERIYQSSMGSSHSTKVLEKSFEYNMIDGRQHKEDKKKKLSS